MQSKISLVNNEIWKVINRTVGWIAIVHFLVLFFAIPLEILTTSSEEHRKYFWIKSIFHYNFEIQYIVSIGIPVLMAIFLFRFLQVKPYSDFFHSLPVKRNWIFHQFVLIGLILLITPIILIAIIVLVLYQPLHLVDFFTIADIFIWLSLTILFNLLIYLSGVLVGMLSGISAVQGVLTYIALLLPSGFLILLIYNLPFYFYGFPEGYFLESKLEAFSPLVALSLIEQRQLGIGEIVIYILLIIVLYRLSLHFYKKRPLEAVSQALVFPLLKPVFKYGATFCTMLLGGMYFGLMEIGSIWIIAGYFFGAIIGYIISEMVLQKSWRIIIHLKGLLIYSGIIVVLGLLFQIDFTSYEKTVPAVNEIERVHLSSSYYQYDDSEKPFYLRDSENIELITRLHKEIIANKNINKTRTNKKNQYDAFFVYELKNGKKLVRNYVINKKEYAHFYKLIHESDEFKQVTNRILHVKTAEIEKIAIIPYGPISKKVVIVDPKDLQEAITILQEEVYSATYEETQDERDAYSSISITQHNNKTIALEWRKSFKKFERWLEEKGLLADSRVNPDDISYALIAHSDDLEIDYSNGYSNEEVFNKMKHLDKAIKVTDKELLKICLENSNGYVDGPYIVGIYYKSDGAIEIKSFTGNNIPEFVREGF